MSQFRNSYLSEVSVIIVTHIGFILITYPYFDSINSHKYKDIE